MGPQLKSSSQRSRSRALVDLDAYVIAPSYDPFASLTLVVPPDGTRITRAITLDFNALPGAGTPEDPGPFRELVYWIYEGFKLWVTGRSGLTFRHYYQSLKHFFTWLLSSGEVIKTPAQLTNGLLAQYQRWICRPKETGGCWSGKSQSFIWNGIRFPLKALQEARPHMLRSDLNLHSLPCRVSAGHPNVQSSCRVIDGQQLKHILSVCWTETRRYIQLYRWAAAEMGKAPNRHTESIPVDWSNQGEVLCFLRRFSGGRRDFTERDRKALYAKVKEGLLTMPLRKLSAAIYPRRLDVLPFLILISARLYGNPDAVRGLPTNCLDGKPDASDPSRVEAFLSAFGNHETVSWHKGRAGRTQRLYFMSSRPKDPPALIREVLEITAPLRCRAPAKLADRLFIYSGGHGEITSMTCGNSVKTLNDFIKLHALPDFDLGDLRQAGLDEAYRLTNGNIFAVQALANHKSPETTRAHYLRTAARAENDRLLGELASEMERWVERGTVRLTEISHDQDGVSGEMVRTVIAAFADPHLIFEGSREKAARILQLKEHLEYSRGRLHEARWLAVCDPLLQLLNLEILPRFNADVLESASRLVSSMPPLPPIQ
jgi:hypothetical protein